MPAMPVAWVFPGQGAQQVGMGRDLYEGSPAARRLFDQADAVLGYAISSLCFAGPEDILQETQHAQPAIFTASLACLEAARELGGLVEEPPVCVAGHSLGEYTALAAAKAIGFEDGLRLVAERGRLMQQAADERPGAMAALLGLDEEAVAAICRETGAEVCNLNAPGQTVIGGTAEAVDAAMALALERGAQRGVRLKVSGAFHTSHMASAAEGMQRAVAEAAIADAAVPVIANTTGNAISSAADIRAELVEQLCRPVQWTRSVETMRAHGAAGVIEFGPGRVLSGLVRRIDRRLAVQNVSDVAGARVSSPTPAPP